MRPNHLLLSRDLLGSGYRGGGGGGLERDIVPQAELLDGPQGVSPRGCVIPPFLVQHLQEPSGEGRGFGEVAPPPGQGGEGVEETRDLLTEGGIRGSRQRKDGGGVVSI